MNNFFCACFLFVCIFKSMVSFASIESEKSQFSYVSSELQQAIDLIESLPEAVVLIKEAQKEGPIRFEAGYFYKNEFEAFWDGKNRIIYVNIPKNPSIGKIISSVLFELHNAKTENKFDTLSKQARSGLIDKDQYVESMERVEYQNALDTTKIIEKGIAEQIFPLEARWKIHAEFDDHYIVQQVYGHSLWHANRFDFLRPDSKNVAYQGTIQGLDKMSPEEKNKILRNLRS